MSITPTLKGIGACKTPWYSLLIAKFVSHPSGPSVTPKSASRLYVSTYSQVHGTVDTSPGD